MNQGNKIKKSNNAAIFNLRAKINFVTDVACNIAISEKDKGKINIVIPANMKWIREKGRLNPTIR